MNLPMEHYLFKKLPLEEIKNALNTNLTEHFEKVDVNIVKCPNLSKNPYNLATEGFGDGEIGIIDLGGPPYLLPLVDRSKVYDLRKIVPQVSGNKNFSNGWYINGAGAGPWPSQGSNCEMMINMKIESDGTVINKSKVALTSMGKDLDVNLKDLDHNETRCALLANFMVSSGEPGYVLEIKCSERKSPENFTTCIRESLRKNYPNEPVGLGGIFIVDKSDSKIHIMRDFLDTKITSEEGVNEWLKFFDMEPPLLCQSVLVSSDPGLDLRIEHSHGWSINPKKKEGGHYHYDLMPKTVEYTGYYAVAQHLWRVDRPRATHLLGRD